MLLIVEQIIAALNVHHACQNALNVWSKIVRQVWLFTIHLLLIISQPIVNLLLFYRLRLTTYAIRMMTVMDQIIGNAVVVVILMLFHGSIRVLHLARSGMFAHISAVLCMNTVYKCTLFADIFLFLLQFFITLVIATTICVCLFIRCYHIL